jgi:hypothetical protein
MGTGSKTLGADTAMEDIISHGSSPPGGWRRRVVFAVVLLVLASLAAVKYIGQTGTGKPPRPAAAGPSGVRHRTVPGSAVIVGPVQPWAAATRIPRTGVQPGWLSPSSGAVQPIGGLPRYGLGYAFTRIDGGWVLQAKPARPATCGDCSVPTSSTQAGCDRCIGPPAAVYYLGNNARTVTTIGFASMVAPAATPDSAWLTTFPTNTGLGASAGVAREYGSDGQPRGLAVRLPAGYKIAQATSKGLLLAPLTGRQVAGEYQLWDPATRKVTRTFRDVVAATGSEVAIASRCPGNCPLHLINLVTGRESTLRLVRGHPVAAEFSPDDRYLAVQVRFGTGRAFDSQVDIVTLATRKAVAIPSTWVSNDAFGGFGWPGKSDYLAAKLLFGVNVQLAFWNAVSSTTAVAYLGPSLNPKALVIR